MDKETIPVKFLFHNSEIVTGDLVLYETAPEDRECVKMEAFVSSFSFSCYADNFFLTLSLLRKEFEKNNLQILCNGSAENVCPSPMQINSTKAYRLRHGAPALMSDIVGIFDYDESLEFVSVEKQELFYKDWLKSLKE